jgi:hypothetical protein
MDIVLCRLVIRIRHVAQPAGRSPFVEVRHPFRNFPGKNKGFVELSRARHRLSRLSRLNKLSSRLRELSRLRGRYCFCEGGD